VQTLIIFPEMEQAMSNSENKPTSDVYDLRSALELLKTLPGEYVETDTEVDPHAELSGVYRYVGAGGTCQRPTRKNGPVMVFNKVKGFHDISVAIGLNGSRKRVSHFLNCPQEKLGHLLKDSVQNPIPPVLSQDDAVCQQVVHLASDLISICANYCLHRPIPKRMQARTSRWGCAMPPIRKPANPTSPFTACVYRAVMSYLCG
jgi:4-hydroxy-3-polyprenylbenzoate decarboxylase